MILDWFRHIAEAFRDPGCLACRNPEPVQGNFCRSCISALGIRPNVPLFEVGEWPVYAASRFTQRTRQLIYGYKFYGRRQNLRLLEAILGQYWQGRLESKFSQFDRICWVPLPPHAGREFHLLPLVRQIAAPLSNTDIVPLLQWERETVPQHHLKDRRSRIENLEDCFSLAFPAWEKWVRKQPVTGSVLWVVFDDIVTTGTTMRQGLKALEAGLVQQLGRVPGQIIGLSVTQVPLTRLHLDEADGLTRA